MDFWDLTRLLARRWAIALPMLALSGLLVTVTVSQAKPDYIASSYVQLVPPAFAAAIPGQATPDYRNPWLTLGPENLANAAIVTVTDGSMVDQLVAGGYSDTFTVTLAERSPVVTFEIIGKSREQALRTADKLVDRFSRSVAALQSGYGVSAADSTTARRLDFGTNVTKSSRVTRALVAVGSAGILMSAAVTVAADAWLRRRPAWSRRRQGADRRRQSADPQVSPA